jgi:plastocyanin
VRRGSLALVALLAASVSVTGAADAAKSKKKPKKLPAKIVKIYDNYYAPAKLTVQPDQKVKWKWPVDIGDSHDVKTKSVPKGAKKFQSQPYAVGATYTQTFTKPGTYQLYCTFHPTEMTMTVVVKKKK